jgi:hypothetical protein
MRIHRENGLRGLTFGVAIVAAVAGCRTMEAAVDVSAPTAIPEGFAGKIDPDGSTTLYLQDLELIIEARNHRPHDTGLIWEGGFLYFIPIVFPVGRVSTTYDEENGGGPLTVSMTLDPEVAGFTFEPAGPAITLHDGSTHSAAEFLGPDEVSCAGVWAKVEPGRKYPLLPGRKTCFLLRFPSQASPETSFLLSFTGLSLQGDPTPAFELSFAKFSVCPFSSCAVE